MTKTVCTCLLKGSCCTVNVHTFDQFLAESCNWNFLIIINYVECLSNINCYWNYYGTFDLWCLLSARFLFVLMVCIVLVIYCCIPKKILRSLEMMSWEQWKRYRERIIEKFQGMRMITFLSHNYFQNLCC